MSDDVVGDVQEPRLEPGEVDTLPLSAAEVVVIARSPRLDRSCLYAIRCALTRVAPWM